MKPCRSLEQASLEGVGISTPHTIMVQYSHITCVCIHIYICIYTYIPMYIYIYIHIRIFACICICTCICLFACLHRCISHSLFLKPFLPSAQAMTELLLRLRSAPPKVREQMLQEESEKGAGMWVGTSCHPYISSYTCICIHMHILLHIHIYTYIYIFAFVSTYQHMYRYN